MRIAVTGATGNIGSALLRRLAAGGHEVVGLARRTPDTTDPAWGKVDWVAADLTEESCHRTLADAFGGADAVVHLAWGFQPSHRPGYLEELGVGGTARVLDAAATVGLGHVVHMSSIGAYSPRTDQTPVDESYPTDGVPTSPYSTHKVAAERLLDEFETTHPTVTVARMRPGIVGQASAGSALLRYALPAIVPATVLRLLPLLPLDRALVVPMVHTDDVADAVTRVVQRGAGGAFNLAAEPPVTVAHIAAALNARHVQVPAPAVRAAAAAAWHLRLQPVDPGWLDLAYSVPVLDTTRAREELGWTPSTDAVSVLREVIAGMTHVRSAGTPALRPRTAIDRVGSVLARGPAALRRKP